MTLDELYSEYNGKFFEVANGKWPQCVSLIYLYMMKVFWIDRQQVRRNAKDRPVELPKKYPKLFKSVKWLSWIKKGDIIVSTTMAAPYGHIGIYWANWWVGKVQILNQNWGQSGTRAPGDEIRLQVYQSSHYDFYITPITTMNKDEIVRASKVIKWLEDMLDLADGVPTTNADFAKAVELLKSVKVSAESYLSTL
jgi:hypothetical protein